MLNNYEAFFVAAFFGCALFVFKFWLRWKCEGWYRWCCCHGDCCDCDCCDDTVSYDPATDSSGMNYYMARTRVLNMDKNHITPVIMIVVLFLTVLLLMACLLVQAKRKLFTEYANQTADIWNISGRVNHQDGAITSEPQRWPTHDHHVSIDSFVVPEGRPGSKKDRVPPPPYSEVDLPTYEQAIALPKPKDDLVGVHVVAASSSTSSAANAS